MTEVNLLLTGSFNPVTLQHLRMLEIARDHLRELDIVVNRGFVSPVHDGYGKAGLLPIEHRSAMLKSALESSNWIELSSWESEQSAWTPTYEVLRHHTKSVCVENGTNSSANHGRIKKRKLQNDLTSNDVNDNPNQSARVMFICGADNLVHFPNPNIWSPDHIKKILTEHGLVCITRIGFDIDKIIYESDLLYEHRKHIIVVREHVESTISSTAIRRACSRGLSIKYLVPDKVEQYIQKHKLYSSVSKSARVENEFGRIQFRSSVKRVRTKNIKTPIVSTSKGSSNKKSDLKKNMKVGRLPGRSKNVVKSRRK